MFIIIKLKECIGMVVYVNDIESAAWQCIMAMIFYEYEQLKCMSLYSVKNRFNERVGVNQKVKKNKQ